MKQCLSLEIRNIKTHVFWPIIEAVKFINYNNRQWPNPTLDTQKCFDTWKENCSETSRKEEFTSKRTLFSHSKQNQNYQNESYLTQ